MIAAGDRAVQMLRDGFSARQASAETGLSQDEIAAAVRAHRIDGKATGGPEIPSIGSTDALLSHAAAQTDATVKTAHTRTLKALENLRDALRSTSARAAAAEALEAAEKALEEARAQARAVGIKRRLGPEAGVTPRSGPEL